ncbi:MAG: hypothetical protein RL087_1588 [Pseudomonadota bacterium]|jgi:hypothetical protein
MDAAIAASPTLARLADQARASQALLQAVQPLLPTALRPAVQAGPLEGAEWCLLVSGNAAAAKIRQQLPDLVAALHRSGRTIDTIRVKVLQPRR